MFCLFTDIDEDVINGVVEHTEGFSGREINKLAVAWQAAAYGQTDATLNRALLEEVLDTQLAQKKIKIAWTKTEHDTYNTITDTSGSASPPVIDFAK